MKKFLCFFLFIFLTPFIVQAETYYFDYSDYYYSYDEIEESNEVEVEEILENDKVIYKYRFRNYLILPDDIVINDRDFKITDVMQTNISFDKFIINEIYNLDDMNHCEASVDIYYKNDCIRKNLYIDIDYYVNVPDVINIEDYDFDIWDYIETDIPMLESITIEGGYDLNINGEYYLSIIYEDTIKDVKLIVDIEDNKDKPLSKDEIVENTNDKKIIYTKNEYTYNYSNNIAPYEIMKEEDLSCPIPVNTRIIYDDSNKENNLFSYISYAFYLIMIILLSIIVVRKK